MKTHSIFWFRKSLRLHDNPALLYAIQNSEIIYPIFILDPFFVNSAKVGPNRWRFLLESLSDLNESLKKINSALLVLKGEPRKVLEGKFKEWQISLLCYEKDSEPYAKKRDKEIDSLAKTLKIKVFKSSSHTLYDLDFLFNENGNKVPLSYTSMLGLVRKVGEPETPLMNPIPQLFPLSIHDLSNYQVPNLEDIKVNPSECGPRLYPGGETNALERLNKYLEKEEWIAKFEKPNTSPNSLTPSTTVLSPYLKFGCLSVRNFFFQLRQIEKKQKNTSQPPVSLVGQLLWREFFYLVGCFTPNFDKIVGNPICRQIKWDSNEECFLKWKNAKTGFPFIDAIMTQLRTEGWIHHLARHAVACFLTRGDLYISWEQGQMVFEEWLLDADWSLNAANWMWLSASSFFYQYWRVYSPIEFGKKTDKTGNYIRKYLPVLKNMPTEFIYEPWKAPEYVQRKAKCIIGVDYPFPMLDHKEKSKENIERMKYIYSAEKKGEDRGKELERKTIKKMKI